MLPLTYFLKVALCSTAFLAYYFIALRNKQFHQFNRFYLLISVVASWLIPLIQFQITPEQKLQQPIYQAFSYIAESNDAFEIKQTKEIAKSFNWMQLLPAFYFAISCIILTASVISLLKVYRIYKKYPKKKKGNITLIDTVEEGTPFSFFRCIFWNENIDADSLIGKQIFQHELTHVQEKHSYDKIFVQVNLVFGWFNPCFWLLKKELEMIHEFLADSKAVKKSNAADFASMLLVAAFPTHHYRLTNPFFVSPIKRRFTMITQTKIPKFNNLRRLVILPLLAIIVLLFAFKKPEMHSQLNGTRAYKIVIDAGHGGEDVGCKSADGIIYEKDIVLEIVKAIKKSNNDRSIEIILTRDDDHFNDLKDRAEFINNQDPDLCVSIHCNDGGKNEKINGSVIYVANPQIKNSIANESVVLANSMNSILKKDFQNRSIKTESKGITLLRAVKCPAIILETGYLSNDQDVAMLSNTDKQELLAKSILNGIENYLALTEE